MKSAQPSQVSDAAETGNETEQRNMQQILHELEVQRIELDVQNEELQHIPSELNRSLNRPPKEQWQTLYQAVKIGDVTEVRMQLNTLKQAHPQYATFWNKLEHLAHTFQFKKLGEVLEGSIPDSQG